VRVELRRMGPIVVTERKVRKRRPRARPQVGRGRGGGW
jgi:hypothetical protein